MSDIEAYMEAYFTQALSDAERKQFEAKCSQDAVFARQVALYISTEEGIRQQLLNQKKQQWRNINKDESSAATSPVRRLTIRKWMLYAAAACVLLAVVLIATLRPANQHQLANEYIAQHFTYLSQTMGASSDTLQQGIAAYNNKDYHTALQLFEAAYQSNSANSKAKKNIGLVYLATGKYEQAMQQFTELANTPGLYDNPGLFLMAITLLKRDTAGDETKAKALLQQVVQQHATGSKEAAQWLNNWR